MDVLNKLFKDHFRVPAEHVRPVQGELGGSGRQIIRLSAGKHSAIGVLYGVREENAAFLAFSRHFRRHGLPVPEIYGEDLDQGAYLEEDLGDQTLFDLLSRNRTGEIIAEPVIQIYHRVVAELPRFQIEAGRDLDYSVCYPRGSFDRQSINWDLNYFKYYFLRLAAIPFNEQALEDDFGRLTEFFAGSAERLFSVPGFSVAQHFAARRAAIFCRLSRRPQGRVAIRRRIAAVRRQGRSAAEFAPAVSGRLSGRAWRTYSFRSRAHFCITTMLSFTCASCRRWAHTGSAASMNASHIFCKACLTR